jgi:glycosyltransferase involved in cell wall biosynthesis
MDYRDPFTGYVDTTSLIKRWLDRRIENLFLRRADGVTAVCESLGSDILRVAPFLAGRVHVIRNAPDWEHGKGPAASRGHDRRHMIVAHVGSLTRVRDPRPFLDGVALALKGGALDRARFRLRLVGFVTKEWSLPALLEERGLGDVTQATGFVPQAQAIEELRSADLAVLIGASVAEWNGRVRPVPVKLYEYLAAGTAILACDDGAEVGEILRQHGCDRIVGSRDPAGVANGLANAFADWQGGRLARPRAPTEPEFDPREQARRLALVLDGQRAGGA